MHSAPIVIALVAMTASPVLAAPTPSLQSDPTHFAKRGALDRVGSALKGAGGRFKDALKPVYDDVISKGGHTVRPATGVADDAVSKLAKAVTVTSADENAVKILFASPDKLDDLGQAVYKVASTGNGQIATKAQNAFYRGMATKSQAGADNFAISMVEKFGSKADDALQFRVYDLAQQSRKVGAARVSFGGEAEAALAKSLRGADSNAFLVKMLRQFPERVDDLGHGVYTVAMTKGPLAADAQGAFYRGLLAKKSLAADLFAVKAVKQFGDKADDVLKARVMELSKVDGPLKAQAKAAVPHSIFKPTKKNALVYLAVGGAGIGAGFLLLSVIGKPGQPSSEAEMEAIPEEGALTTEQEDQIIAYLSENPDKLQTIIDEIRLLPDVSDIEMQRITDAVSVVPSAKRSLSDLD